MLKRLALSGLVVCSATGHVHAQPGYPVQSFGTGGVFFLPSDCWFDGASSVERAPDGKLLVGRGCNDVGTLTRLEQSGAIDTTFGDSGTVVVDQMSGAGCMHAHSDGSIVLTSSTYDTCKVVRLLSDGTIDPSFAGGAPIVITAPGSLMRLRHLAVNQGGEVFIAVSVADTFQIRKYDVDGSPTIDFGQNGTVTTSALDGSSSAGNMVSAADGKLLLYWRLLGPSWSDAKLLRLNADGTVDTGFGTAGTVTIDQAAWDDPWDVVELSSGELLVSGGTDVSGFVKKLAADGTVVQAFGLNGALTLPFINDTSYVFHRTVQEPLGGLVLVGAYSVDGTGNLGLVRVTPAGQLDSGFGDGGLTLIDLPGDGEGLYDAVHFDDLDLACVGTMSDFGPTRAFVVKIETGLNIGIAEDDDVRPGLQAWPNPTIGGPITAGPVHEPVNSVEIIANNGRSMIPPTWSQDPSTGLLRVTLPQGMSTGIHSLLIRTGSGVVTARLSLVR